MSCVWDYLGSRFGLKFWAQSWENEHAVRDLVWASKYEQWKKIKNLILILVFDLIKKFIGSSMGLKQNKSNESKRSTIKNKKHNLKKWLNSNFDKKTQSFIFDLNMNFLESIWEFEKPSWWFFFHLKYSNRSMKISVLLLEQENLQSSHYTTHDACCPIYSYHFYKI